MFQSTDLQQSKHVTWQNFSGDHSVWLHSENYALLKGCRKLSFFSSHRRKESDPQQMLTQSLVFSTLEKSTHFSLLVHKARSPFVNTVANEAGLHLPSQQHKLPHHFSFLLAHNDKPLLHIVCSSSQPQLPPLVASNSTWLHTEQLTLQLVKWSAIQQLASAYWNM